MSNDEELIWLRPEHSTAGRPATWSRDEITTAAVEIADRDGLDAVSMRSVASSIGTGAASLYRYLNNREDLVALMLDFVTAEYQPQQPSSRYVTDLIAVSEQIHAIMMRHPWVPELMLTRPDLGPNSMIILENVLHILADHPTKGWQKIDTFSLINIMSATFALNEISAAPHAERNFTYMQHVALDGTHPHIAQLADTLDDAQQEPTDRRATMLSAVIRGLLSTEDKTDRIENSQS